jgi:hypothetical protein
MSATPGSSLDKELVETFSSSWQPGVYAVVVGVIFWLLVASADRDRRRHLRLWPVAGRGQR